jgi:hypothetical protein
VAPRRCGRVGAAGRGGRARAGRRKVGRWRCAGQAWRAGGTGARGAVQMRGGSRGGLTQRTQRQRERTQRNGGQGRTPVRGCGRGCRAGSRRGLTRRARRTRSPVEVHRSIGRVTPLYERDQVDCHSGEFSTRCEESTLVQLPAAACGKLGRRSRTCKVAVGGSWTRLVPVCKRARAASTPRGGEHRGRAGASEPNSREARTVARGRTPHLQGRDTRHPSPVSSASE